MAATATAPPPPLPRFSFVHVSHPGDAAGSAAESSARHSHSAREFHARARRERTLKYQAAQAKSHREQVAAREEGGPAAPNAQLVALMHPSPSSRLSAARIDPFGISTINLSPVEHFLFDHYVQIVIPTLGRQCLSTTSWQEPGYYEERMINTWIPMAISDPAMMHSIFLAASRSMAGMDHSDPRHQRLYTQLAMRYKVSCLHLLGQVIASAAPTKADVARSVATALMLASDDYNAGEPLATQQHITGAVRMTVVHGGVGGLGLDGFLDKLLSIFVSDPQLRICQLKGGAGKESEDTAGMGASVDIRPLGTLRRAAK